MLIRLKSDEKEYAAAGQDVVRIFYPDARIVFETAEKEDLTLTVFSYRENSLLVADAKLNTGGNTVSERVSTQNIPVSGDERNHQKRLVKLALFRLLSKFTGKPPGPWGILTGIRPTKIVHRLLDIGWVHSDIVSYLTLNYDMSPEKGELLTALAGRQRHYLLNPEKAAKAISVYIGIPFCPTRCAYCSFPAYPVNRSGQLLEPFLTALLREIKIIGSLLKDWDKQVQTIYIGGGTPTVLDDFQLSELLKYVNSYLSSEATVEITLEAGRPDTVTEGKLRTAFYSGVNRLSINPQTMNSSTLESIGRRHTPLEIVKAMDAARKTGFKNVNMDIILGLPGETIPDVCHTLKEITELRPENLTVHTLAVKRASNIKEDRDSYAIPGPEVVTEMLDLTAQAAEKMNMHPYYLYRQKNIVGNLENVGYAVPGYDCLYNIQMIEERQSIIGFGGGAGSKFVDPGTWYLTSHYNPKDPETYIARIDEIIARKEELLKNFFATIPSATT